MGRECFRPWIDCAGTLRKPVPFPCVEPRASERVPAVPSPVCARLRQQSRSRAGRSAEAAGDQLSSSFLLSLDEYIHGIQNALDGDACLLCLLPSQGPDRDRMLRLVNFSKSVGACCGLISPSDTGQPDALHLLDAGEDALQSLEFLLALQTLAAELSAARGIDSSHRRYSDFFSIMGSKMEGDICQPKL